MQCCHGNGDEDRADADFATRGGKKKVPQSHQVQHLLARPLEISYSVKTSAEFGVKTLQVALIITSQLLDTTEEALETPGPPPGTPAMTF